jgi:hypothetical protein
MIETDNMVYYQIGGEDYVLYQCRRYPCFDSYDYLHEKRCFRTYYLCRSPEEVREKYNYLTSGNLFFANENPGKQYRAPLLPYVYADDDMKEIKIYETVDN